MNWKAGPHASGKCNETAQLVKLHRPSPTNSCEYLTLLVIQCWQYQSGNRQCPDRLVYALGNLRVVPWNCDPAVMPLIEAAQREFNPKRRLKLLQEIMRVYHEDAVMLYVAETVSVDGLSKRVRDYEPVNRIINYHQIRLLD